MRQLLVSKDCFSGVLSVVKVSLNCANSYVRTFLSHHLQALNIRNLAFRVKDGDAHAGYVFEALKCSFASVARSCGHNHDALAGGGSHARSTLSVDSASYARVLASNTHQAGEHLKRNVFESRRWTMEEFKQPVFSDSRNRRDGLGIPLSAISTLNAAIQLFSRVIIQQRRKHVISGGLKALSTNLCKIKGFLANRILNVKAAIGSNSLQNGLLSQDVMVRASCAVICDGHETTNLLNVPRVVRVQIARLACCVSIILTVRSKCRL